MSEPEEKKKSSDEATKSIRESIAAVLPEVAKCSTITDEKEKEQCIKETTKRLEEFVDDVAIGLDPIFDYIDSQRRRTTPPPPPQEETE